MIVSGLDGYDQDKHKPLLINNLNRPAEREYPRVIQLSHCFIT